MSSRWLAAIAFVAACNSSEPQQDAGRLDAGSSDSNDPTDATTESDGGTEPDAATMDAATMDGGTTDGGTQIGTCGPGEIWGRFEIMSTPMYGSFYAAHRDGMDLFQQTTRVLERGPCRLYTGDPEIQCDPACEPSEFCGKSGCFTIPNNVDLGVLRLAGTNPELEFTVRPGNVYYSQDNHPDLLPVGQTARLEVEGGGGIDSFTLEANGIAEIVPPMETVRVVQHEDLVLTWAPSGGEGDLVRIRMDSDHHGALGVIECEVPDGDGMVVVDAELIDGIIEAGHSGIGTYIESSTFSRVNRSHARTALGCAEFAAVSLEWFFTETILAE
jgi:hypothetical protein